MIFDHFLLDPDGHVKDLICGMITPVEPQDGKKERLEKATKLKDDRIIKDWAHMHHKEVHPEGTGKELERLRKLEADMKKVLGVEE